MKKNYDKKHMERSYKPGELVAVWTPIRKIGKCEKLLRKYFGPYRIFKKMSSVNYLIEPKDNPGQDPLIVHVSRIKPYYERMDEVIYEDVGTIDDLEISGRPRVQRTQAAIKAIRERIRRNPRRKQKILAKQMNLAPRTVSRIINEDLGLRAFKRRTGHLITPALRDIRRTNVPEFIKTNEWPSGSPDLNPLDYSLRAYLEEKVCYKIYHNFDQLKSALVRAMKEIPLEKVRAAIDQWPERLRSCVKNKEGHFE
ncbi:WNT5B [Cordylochernes scorpioides]|uniref:WNT5B n=1 Tax=Cordylochernes scorpioides TaxID=51811 RepID=A0ABY6LGB7_9ARAC|nr:WNT5B [Cordylochernes scorpioides]